MIYSTKIGIFVNMIIFLFLNLFMNKLNVYLKKKAHQQKEAFHKIKT